MPRRAKGLTAAQVEKGATPGRFGDGGGLYLLVRSREAKFWLFRYTRAGKMREMGLGPAVGRSAVSLAEARAKSRKLHDQVREGKDPLVEREAEAAKAKADAVKAAAGAITFAQVANMFIAAREAGWRNPKHRQQWRNTLDQYVLPVLGELPVGDIGTAEVMTILEPLWVRRTETASRVRGRIESILDYARVRNWRDGENPARWRGHLDHLLPQRSKVRRVEHHGALPWRECGAFVERLRQRSGISARALEFTIVTAARSGEVRGATWAEIDLNHAVWTIPGERMKAGKEHRVPLSDAALGVLREMAKLGTEASAHIFPGGRVGRPLSDVAVCKAVRAAGGDGATAHGFRSSFRDWAGEATAFPREVIEMALAHRLGDAAEQAYARGDLLERRRRLMAEWAAFCAKPTVVGEVVALRTAG